ncbi:hypothetical protein ACYOEI_13245 [Singulisphaera rosea]
MSVTIQFDYTYDNTGFFAPGSEARTILEQAGSYLGSHLNDHLAAIPGNPGAGNTWSAQTFDPRNINSTLNLTNLAVSADTIIVYAGASALPSGVTGKGVTGGTSSSGSASWNQLVGTRGQVGAQATSTTSRTDTGLWGGSVTFSTLTQFSFTPMGTASVSGKADFLATALNEVGHVLGLLPTWPGSETYREGINTFEGLHSQYSYGGPITLDATATNWAAGTQSFGEDAIMDADASYGSYPQGARFTPLDWAAMVDAGWQIDTLTVTATPQVTVGKDFWLTVTALDPTGSVDKLYSGTITLSLANNPTGATLDGTRFFDGTISVVSFRGVAAFTDLTLDKVGSGYTILVSTDNDTPSVTTAPFSATLTSPAATHLAIVSAPSSVKTNAPFSVTVQALDANGHVDTNYSGPIRLSTGTNGSEDYALSGILTINAVHGVATFNTSRSDTYGVKSFTLSASGAGLTTATTPSIAMRATATTLKGQVTSSGSVTPLVPFTLVVKATDANGNVDPDYSGMVTLSLGTSPSGGVLGGTLTVQAVNGVATFTGLTVNRGGTFWIKATSGSLTSGAGVVALTVKSTPTQLAITTQPSSVVAGQAFTIVVTFEDANGFPTPPLYTGYDMVLSLAENPGNGMLSAPFYLRTSVIKGVATFTGLWLNKPAAGYVIKATVLGGTEWSPTLSAPITVTQNATQLEITTQPPSVVEAGAAFTVIVKAKDADGNFDPDYPGPVTLSLAANPGDGMLGGTLTVNTPRPLQVLLQDVVATVPTPSGVELGIDVDPVNLL